MHTQAAVQAVGGHAAKFGDDGGLARERWRVRRIEALGRQAELISPQFVRPFVPGNMNNFPGMLPVLCRYARRFGTPAFRVDEADASPVLLRGQSRPPSGKSGITWSFRSQVSPGTPHDTP